MLRYLLAVLLLQSLTLSAQRPPPLIARDKRLDSLQRIAGKAVDDTEKVKMLNELTWMYLEIASPKSENYARQTLALSQKIHWQKGIAMANETLGLLYDAVSDYPHAMDCYMQALNIAEQLGDKNLMAKNQLGLAAVYDDLSDYSHAIGYFSKALKNYEEIHDSHGIADCYDGIATNFSKQKKYDSAIQYHYKALREFSQTGDGLSVAATMTNLADDYHGQGKYYKALEYHTKALDLSRHLEHIYFYEINLGKIGRDYLAIAKDTELFPSSARLSTGKRDNLLAAVKYLDSTLEIEKRRGDLYHFQFFNQDLAQAQELLGNYELALRAYEAYSSYKDSVFNEDNKTKIARLESQREIDLRENKINLLDLRAQKERLTRRLMTTGITLIILIAGAVIMYYVRRQKTERIIANERINAMLKEQELSSVSSMLEVQEIERRRIATDLHDRLGSMLSTVKLYFGSVEEQIDNMKQQNREQYNKATSLLDEACDEVRKISHDLVSGELIKFGLASALRQMATTIEDTGQLKVKVLEFGLDQRLDSSIEIALYRVVQELMNNILKHAKATEVSIQLNRTAGNLNVLVEDNGIGFDVVQAKGVGGMGLRNAETRVKKLNGNVSFDSAKGRGTTTIIDVPL